jgi:hypothetical protein
MQITFAGSGAPSGPSTVRYELAWAFPQPEFRKSREVNKITWWLDASCPNEQVACARLKEIQEAIVKRQGSLAVYEVHYDESNRIVSERVLARCGAERPPFRYEVLIPTAQLKAIFTNVSDPSSGKKGRKKSEGMRRMVAALVLAGGFGATIGTAVFFAGTSWREADERKLADRAMQAERFRNEPGQILMPRGDAMCDRLLFDNNAGGVRIDAAVPCGSKTTKVVNDKATDFSASWRGGQGTKP